MLLAEGPGRRYRCVAMRPASLGRCRAARAVRGPAGANESLRALLADKDAKIAGLEAQVAAQAERIARLERLISGTGRTPRWRPAVMTSRQTPPAWKEPAAPEEVGATARVPRQTRPWSDHPDRTEDLFPACLCECGTDLRGAADLGVVFSHQVSDLPEEVRARPCSTTGTRWNAPAAGCTWQRPRRRRATPRRAR